MESTLWRFAKRKFLLAFTSYEECKMFQAVVAAETPKEAIVNYLTGLGWEVPESVKTPQDVVEFCNNRNCDITLTEIDVNAWVVLDLLTSDANN